MIIGNLLRTPSQSLTRLTNENQGQGSLQEMRNIMRTMTELAQKLEIQQDQQRIPIAKQSVRSLTKSHKKTLRVSHISL
jgi:hypothetical protein